MIDDSYYLDGGFHDYIPANSLLEKGYDKVYVIDLEAIGIRRPYKYKEKITIIKPSRKLGSILDFKQEDIKIGCFGPTTAKAVKEAGLRLDVEAPTPEAPSMTAALELYLKKEMGSNKKNGK